MTTDSIQQPLDVNSLRADVEELIAYHEVLNKHIPSSATIDTTISLLQTLKEKVKAATTIDELEEVSDKLQVEISFYVSRLQEAGAVLEQALNVDARIQRRLFNR